MLARSQGHTTVPSRANRGHPAAGGSLAIRWVFPRNDGPVTLLPKEPIVIGRGSESRVDLASEEVSRQHAEVRAEGVLRIIRDLKSKNGVWLDGVRIDEAPLSVGDVLRIGDWIGVAVGAPEADGGVPVFRTLAPGLFGGPVLGPVLAVAAHAAESDLPIIVEGETGTGKEGTARAIHAWSGREGPFLAINCAALPETLAEAELFGYRKGAFTGADRASPGHFRAAERGTLLLDEIGDLPLHLQTKLLRVLEQREVIPLGESRAVPVDVRVIATTQGALSQAVAERRFRADLHARLDGVTVRLPPLRERIEEIPYLTTRLLLLHANERVPRLEPALVERLCLHDWPYNVRELDLLCRRLLTLHRHEPELLRAHLPERMLAPGAPPAAKPDPPARTEEREPPEVAALLDVLRATEGNVRRTAAQLGISRQRVYRMMEQCQEAELSEIRKPAAKKQGRG